MNIVFSSDDLSTWVKSKMASKMAAVKLKISVISASNWDENTTFVRYDLGQVLSLGKLGGA